MMAEPLWSHRFSSKSSILFCIALGVTFTLCSQYFTGQFGTPLTFIGLLILPPVTWLLLEPFRRRLRLSTGYMLIALPTAIAVGCGLYLHYISDLLRRQQTFMEMQASGAGSRSEARRSTTSTKRAGLRLPMAPMFRSSWSISLGKSRWRVWQNARSPLRGSPQID